MSVLDEQPEIEECEAHGAEASEQLLLTARKVWLGKTTEVRRVLPDRDLRMIGAWCFLDHYGPEDVSHGPGMQVWAHPHTGLQTVSWLFEGEIEHRDGLGSQAMVRPGELNIMTAGHGIVHSELSLPDKPPTMHGVQLWVALPDESRDQPPRFEAYADLPTLRRDGLSARILVGELEDATSPAVVHSPLVGADLELDAGADLTLALDPGFEHGVLAISGDVSVAGVDLEVDQLLYLGSNRQGVRLASRAGGRALLLGGVPFATPIVMWWNFIGRSHQEIVDYREAWVRRDDRFAPVISRDEKVMEAPPMPTVALKPRPARRAGMTSGPTVEGPNR